MRDENDEIIPASIEKGEYYLPQDVATHPIVARTFKPNSTGMRLLREYKTAGRKGLTFEEAASLASVNPWQASKRVSDLRKAGLIELTGKTRVSPLTDRDQRVLRITPAGREAVKAAKK